ncbi:hypothetical protein NDU88_009283 [Pleurodeles waltl]|uniref:Uncharacterized protein n=1 Tax=Pleurodeles waltl TaxID=8319 RepID=A0AAV7PVI9_PLEWA|nr:hypothetical protein NDU88_009283 [Pleurodeles waltl]
MEGYISSQVSVTFSDVAAYFSEKEWRLLGDWQKELYRRVMREIHTALISLGYTILNSDTLLRVKEEDQEQRNVEHKDSAKTGMSTGCRVTPDILCRVRHLPDSPFMSQHIYRESASVTKTITCALPSETAPKNQGHQTLVDSLNTRHMLLKKIKEYSSQGSEKGSFLENQNRAQKVEPRRIGLKPAISTPFKPTYFPSKAQHKPQVPEKQFQCTLCEKSFTTNTFLDVHLRTHTGELSYPCNACDRSFISRANLSRHQISHRGDRPYKCPVCEKSFVICSKLKIHLRNHTGERPYQCTECEKTFTSHTYLTLHQKTHAQERSYQCNQCQKSFLNNSRLIVHQRTHTGERPYKCSECDKRFSDNKSLKLHHRSHTGERPYRCKLCGKGFSSCSNLVRHQKTHARLRPYICTECGKCYNKRIELNQHMQTHVAERQHHNIWYKEQYQDGMAFAKHKMIHSSENSPIIEVIVV